MAIFSFVRVLSPTAGAAMLSRWGGSSLGATSAALLLLLLLLLGGGVARVHVEGSAVALSSARHGPDPDHEVTVSEGSGSASGSHVQAQKKSQ